MSSFGQQLAELIRQQGWNQQTAAEKLGVSQANISRWLSGGHKPSFSKAAEIAAKLGVPLERLTETQKPSGAAVNRVQESQPGYRLGHNPTEAAMHELRKRYRKAGPKERETIRLALAVLFPSQGDAVLTWLDEK